MFFRKQREVERISKRCLELGDELKKKNQENEILKKENMRARKAKGKE